MNKIVSMAALSPLIAEMVQQGKPVVLTVTGNSMFPLFCHRKNRVQLVKADPSNLRKNDIPLYLRSDGTYILHRVIHIRRDGYVMAGDNQCIKEYGIQPDQIVAVVNGFWRKRNFIPCTRWYYRLYSTLWTALFPFRALLLRGIRLASRLRWRHIGKGSII